jgi:hypothetical protein
MEILDTIQSSVLLSLKSNEANIIDGSTVTFILNNPLQCLKGNRMLMSLDSVEIPNTHYLVNSTNNLLTVSIDGINSTLTFPNGNYTVTSFKEKFELLWSSLGNATTLSVLFDEISLKYVLTFSKSGIVNVTLQFSDIMKILGFSKTINTSVNSSDSATVVMESENIVNFQNSKAFYVTTDSFELQNLNSTGHFDNLIAKVQLGPISSGDMIYEKKNDNMYLLQDRTIDSIKLFLSDDYGNKLDSNGHDYSISLKFSFIKEKTNIRSSTLSTLTF